MLSRCRPPPTTERGEQTPPCELRLAPFRHLLVVFGGPQVGTCSNALLWQSWQVAA